MKPVNLLRWAYYYIQRHKDPYRSKWIVEVKLRNLECSIPGTVIIDDWTINYIDARDLKSMWQLQFGQRYNDFYTSNASPRILDCGANIGLSILRYKELYPNSIISAFEPDPQLCDVLRKNVTDNGLSNVEVIDAAVWTSQTELGFASRYKGSTQAGHLTWRTLERDTASFSVKTVWLGEFLKEPVDFLKLDIEGAELPVLQSCKPLLSNIKQLMIEVHYNVNEPQTLIDILTLLREAEFNIAVYQYFRTPPTYMPYTKDANSVSDQFPVLWAWR